MHIDEIEFSEKWNEELKNKLAEEDLVGGKEKKVLATFQYIPVFEEDYVELDYEMFSLVEKGILTYSQVGEWPKSTLKVQHKVFYNGAGFLQMNVCYCNIPKVVYTSTFRIESKRNQKVTEYEIDYSDLL